MQPECVLLSDKCYGRESNNLKFFKCNFCREWIDWSDEQLSSRYIIYSRISAVDGVSPIVIGAWYFFIKYIIFENLIRRNKIKNMIVVYMYIFSYLSTSLSSSCHSVMCIIVNLWKWLKICVVCGFLIFTDSSLDIRIRNAEKLRPEVKSATGEQRLHTAIS